MVDRVIDDPAFLAVYGAVTNSVTTKDGNPLTSEELDTLKAGIKSGKLPVTVVPFAGSNLSRAIEYLLTADNKTLRTEIGLSPKQVEAAMTALQQMQHLSATLRLEQNEHAVRHFEQLKNEPRRFALAACFTTPLEGP